MKAYKTTMTFKGDTNRPIFVDIKTGNLFFQTTNGAFARAASWMCKGCDNSQDMMNNPVYLENWLQASGQA